MPLVIVIAIYAGSFSVRIKKRRSFFHWIGYIQSSFLIMLVYKTASDNSWRVLFCILILFVSFLTIIVIGSMRKAPSVSPFAHRAQFRETNHVILGKNTKLNQDSKDSKDSKSEKVPMDGKNFDSFTGL